MNINTCCDMMDIDDAYAGETKVVTTERGTFTLNYETLRTRVIQLKDIIGGTYRTVIYDDIAAAHVIFDRYPRNHSAHQDPAVLYGRLLFA